MNIMEELPPPTKTEPMVFERPQKTSAALPLPALGGLFDGKNLLIFILLILVIFTYFGINLLKILGDAIQDSVSVLAPFITYVLEFIGITTGHAINSISGATATVAKTGVEIADGTVQNIGNLLIGDNTIGSAPLQKRGLLDPRPDAPEDSIQKSLTAAKTKWCLVGEYQNKRGCIDISESDKCMSGEIFPNEETCMLGKPQFQTN